MRYFAEYLSRINSVALSLEADDVVDEIDAEGNECTVVSSVGRETLALPGSVARARVAPGSAAVSLRLPCQGAATLDRSQQWLNSHPWSAKELSQSEICVTCRHCGHALGSVAQYKQLPSEHWAEMMDFWHCHKPHTTDDFNPAYAVGNLEPKPGLAFVSDAYILVHESDLDRCAHTAEERIWKWDVVMVGAAVESYPISAFVASILYELVDSHAIYSFHITDQQEHHRILLWVFNRDFHYTATGDTAARRGLKVFYSTDRSQFPTLYQTRGDVEEVVLPANAVAEIEQALERTNASLPRAASEFGPWRTAVLGRGAAEPLV